MRHLVLPLALCVSCGPNHHDPLCLGVSGPPGDAQALEWQPPEPPPAEATIIDCGGGTRGRLDVRKSNSVVRNCRIEGDVRVWGLVRSLNPGTLRERSYEDGYVDYVRANAPTNVLLEDVTIVGSGTIPLYVAPGVTFTTIRRVTIEGSSVSTMVYLDAESHGTTIEDSTIDATDAGREAIAIDSSDSNVIRRTTIHHSHGGIYLYRNCGEGGTSRITTPSENEITDNTFDGDGRVAVWLGSRDGMRCYCGEDAEGSYGSAKSDMDHARFNTVTGNELNDQDTRAGSSSVPNILDDTGSYSD
jgi:hypothetical protein